MAVIGFAVHSVVLVIRWIETGHGPYLGKFEVMSSSAWMGIFVFLLVQWKVPALRLAGIIVLPLTFLMIGAGILTSPEIKPIPKSFHTFWLVIHVLFAKMAYGSCLLGTSFGLLQILKNKKNRQA